MRPLVLALLVVFPAACHCGGKLEQVPDGLIAEPALLDFGEIEPGQTRALSVTLTNQGKLRLNLTPDLQSPDFSGAADHLTLEAGASAPFEVTFHPTRAGTFTAQLQFLAGGSSLGVDLIGRAQGGVTSCTAKTCADLGRSCGAADDGCGHPLTCGTCGNGLSCDVEVGACLCPGAGKESCSNGTDDDCDGAVDCGDSDCAGLGACAAAVCTTGFETRLTPVAPDNFSAGADVAWSGTEFGVAWATSDHSSSNTGMDFELARVAAAGTLIAPAQKVTTTGLMAHPPRIAWNGGEWAIASSTLSANRSMNLVEVQRVSSAGSAVGSSLVLGQGWPASIAERPGTSAFGVLWAASLTPIFTEISQGARVGVDSMIPTTSTWIDYGDLVWSGNGWGAAWTQSINYVPGVMFARLDASGAPIGTPVKVSLGDYAGIPRVAWSGTEYGVVWTEHAAPQLGVRFARFDANGAQLGTPVAVGPDASGAPDIIWAGTAFAIVWEDARGGNPATATVWLALYDELGRKVGNDRQVSCGAAGSHRPSVTWSGSALGVAWHDQRHGGYDVYFKREAL